MFRDKTFNFALVFSAAWHLFWMSAVGIVVTPSVQPSNAYQDVDFLGPILEKTAFDLMVEEAQPKAETLYARSTFFLDRVYLKPKGPERRVLREFSSTVFDKFAFLEEVIKDTMEIPLYVPEDTRPSYTKTKDDCLFPSLEGPAKDREVIFKPPPPTVPKGLYGESDKYCIRLKFFIADDGVVYDVKPIVSSGYPEVDLCAMRFLRSWRFSPLSVIEKGKSVWGIATVKVLAE